jgi:hypothetical protein
MSEPWQSTIDLRFERRIDGVRIVSILQRRWIRRVKLEDGGTLDEHEWRDIPVVDSPSIAIAGRT